MSYQVLARKWRPKSFGKLVGQEHVVRALSHALATGRLHHAWLFTGTRGVGKTTISRILAKALNCETGVTAEPCGQCSACVAIDADRFPDYVEMDAASNRGVDDMAALLDQAVYAPVQGRYKVYMIDEVHMLTGHAFNAMLKTLEEPPEHVKFILATTDPQKIPVTVLSRCLQFNLKQMPPGHIVDHLARILDAEQVTHDAAALRLIAKAASGSMRDALSLLDQAIAHGAGRVETEQVGNMLGAVGDDHLFGVLDALAQGDVAGLLAVADDMEARSLSFEAALQSLASLLHRIALVQFAPAAVADAAERTHLLGYARQFDAEFLQLAYQIVIHGRGELSLAPDAYAGFTMTLLRLHAFRPEQPTPLGGGAIAGGGGAGRARAMEAPAAAESVASAPARTPSATERFSALRSQSPRPDDPVGTALVAVVRTSTDACPPDRADRADTPHVAGRVGGVSTSSRGGPEQAHSGDVPPWESLPPEAAGDADMPSPDRAEDQPIRIQPQSAAAQPSRLEGVPHEAACDSLEAALAAGDWHAVPRLISLGGMVRELAQHCEWVSLADDVLTIRLSRAHHHLLDMNPGLATRLGDLISERLGRSLRLKVELGEIAGETPAQRDASERRARHVEAVAALESDPFVRELIERFDATLIEASVKPL
ncbi:DNA polymerase III subunit gamma/tau [Rhodocyclaceae bacterium SMB388]